MAIVTTNACHNHNLASHGSHDLVGCEDNSTRFAGKGKFGCGRQNPLARQVRWGCRRRYHAATDPRCQERIDWSSIWWNTRRRVGRGLVCRRTTSRLVQGRGRPGNEQPITCRIDSWQPDLRAADQPTRKQDDRQNQSGFLQIRRHGYDVSAQKETDLGPRDLTDQWSNAEKRTMRKYNMYSEFNVGCCVLSTKLCGSTGNSACIDSPDSPNTFLNNHACPFKLL